MPSNSSATQSAIRHGVELSLARSVVEIEVAQVDGLVRITVRNDLPAEGRTSQSGHRLVQELAAAVAATVGPAILAAFQFRIEVMEGIRIGCYDAADRGYFRAHHDNTTPATRHRRFAMSINLNTGDYTGGELRFPDYGPQLYVPPIGGAVVFSCSLLHEVLPVTAGRRLGVFTFFCSEADERARLATSQSPLSGRVER